MHMLGTTLLSSVLLMPLQTSVSDSVELVRLCQEGKASLDKITCLAYLRGALDGWAAAIVVGRDLIAELMRQQGVSPAPACPILPDNVTVEQVRQIFLKYMDKHPEQLQLPSAGTLFIAVGQAF